LIGLRGYITSLKDMTYILDVGICNGTIQLTSFTLVSGWQAISGFLSALSEL